MASLCNVPFIILMSVSLSALCSFLVLRLGRKISLVDVPNERSSHSVPTSCGGGIGIVLAFVITSSLLCKEVLITIAAIAVGLLGLLEDCFDLSSRIRLFTQFIISISTVLLFLGWPVSLPTAVLFLFWTVFIVGTMNFYNFMDGINGMAGLTGLVSFGLVAFFSFFIVDNQNIAFLSIALMSACLGFLPFNFPKAKVFMGDVGSLLLGFIFAVFVLKLSTNIGVFLCLIMFLNIFYGDTLITIAYRWKRSESLLKAHREHLYQYMSNELGMQHWKVSILYVIFQLVTGVLAIMFYKTNIAWLTAFVMICIALYVSIYKYFKSSVLH